jgi:hypothetical protein
MKNLTLIIPAKYERESLPIFLKEIEKYECEKIVILKKEEGILSNKGQTKDSDIEMSEIDHV